MAHPWKVLLFWMAAIGAAAAMHIPEDMEILEGYELESAGSDINPEDDFYEQRSLLEPFYYRAIRDKREVPYQVLESPGLKSHFRLHQESEEDFQDEEERYSKKRTRRSAEEAETGTVTEPPKPTEELPKPEKQMMNQRTIETWAKTPYQVQKSPPAKQDDMDSEAEASMMSEGIKARAPRVNFITQKKPHEPEPREDKDKVIPELYRKPLARLFYEYPAGPARAYDTVPAYSASPMFPKIYNKYDEFHRDMMDRMHPPAPHRFDPYYQRRYDNDYNDASYFPRYSFPSYYYYPDKRFDVPSYYRGDRNYLLSNDVMDTMSPNVPPPLYIPSRNRRIIYYATLPEIVRTPPNYRPSHYNKFGGNRFDPHFPTKSPVPLMGGGYKSSTIKYDDRGGSSNGNNVNNGNKDDKYVSSTPIKIVRDIAAQQESPGGVSSSNGNSGRRQYSVKIGGGGGGNGNQGGAGRSSHGYQDGGHYEPDRSYFGRHL